ncbi:MAG: hypothetical protein A2Z93_06285 [Curvibacter sp. GWA2_64_110]|nr:MAG: hypothetical protein A2Z93_06285 [Curvibacter sp. GWA2_64_110]HCY15593.1 hypothetical protein [Curvibacter sp.]
MRLLTLLMLACFLMTGCAFGGPQTPDSKPVKTEPPPNLTAPPQPLPQPDSGRMRDLEANHLQVSKAYHLLASQMCLLLAYLQINHPECQAFEAGRGKTD